MSAARIHRAWRSLEAADLEALVVTHPANIAYLTGLSASTAIAILTAPGRCVLIVDSRYATSARTLEIEMPELTVRVASGALDNEAASQLIEHGNRRVGIEADHLTLSRFNRLNELLAAASHTREDPVLAATTRIIERLRAVKDEREIQILREAGRRISAVARQARRWIRAGRTERQVAAAVDAAMREAGFERPAFETIVASGPNAALPHARPTNRVVQGSEGVLLDFGGVYDGYCVDLSRTVHIGPMREGFRRLFVAVREAQAAALAAVKPGTSGVVVDRAAREVMTRHGLGEAFGHGTGHGLGLEVHEEPRISPLAPENELLLPGMVVTIEPGAYVPGIGGVRIEDDVLVTEGGCELLTDVPIEL